jgi:hypothetical protein
LHTYPLALLGLTNNHSAMMAMRSARAFPEEAIMHARSGLQALKGNLPDQARVSLRQALALNPMLWEAFEGLCSLGAPSKYLPNVASLRVMI